MPVNTKATRAAAQILNEAGVKKLPVNVDAIARLHAFVMRDPLPSDVSGMLIPASPDAKKRWIIVSNKAHSVERRRFTVAHELGHLLLHQYATPHADGGQRVRFRDGASSLGTDRDEVEANQFAAELLMPAALLIPRLEAIGLDSWNGAPPESLTEALRNLAAECRVSEQALLIRVANLLEAV